MICELKPQKSEFWFGMYLLIDSWDTGFWDVIPKNFNKRYTHDERMSMLLTYLIEKEYYEKVK